MGDWKTIITIGREYGAGGRTVAKLLSDRLGIPHYDKEIITLAAEKSGLPEQTIRGPEQGSGKTLLSWFLPRGPMSAYDQAILAQANIIRKLAEEGPCIIVGRGADYILRDREENPGLLSMLPDFNERMCRVGALLIRYRAQYCRALDGYAAPAHEDCSGGREKLTLGYETVKTVLDPFAKTEVIAQNLREHQESHYHAELASGLCLSGPHKDDFIVEVNGRSARQFCSQGQVRTAALSLKLADREIHRSAVGEYPVMLLDDVLSELDPKRQEYVLNRISGGQVFITCCENDRLDRLQAGRLFHIQNGEVLL